jgi:peroxiredoxin
MRADIAPGGVFPDFELTDHTKTRRKLSDLQGLDPMIVVLARGTTSMCGRCRSRENEFAESGTIAR